MFTRASAPLFCAQTYKTTFRIIYNAMGRMPQPTEILDAKGSFIKHPEYKRPDEPVVTKPLGSPPAHLTPEQKKAWKEIAKQIPPGVAKQADRLSMEMMSVLLCKFRDGTAKASESAQLINLLARFGMTPADRTKVSAGEAPKQSRLAAFLKKPTEAPVQ